MRLCELLGIDRGGGVLGPEKRFLAAGLEPRGWGGVGPERNLGHGRGPSCAESVACGVNDCGLPYEIIQLA